MSADTVQVVVPMAGDGWSIDNTERVAGEAISRACESRGLRPVSHPELVWEGTWRDAKRRGAPTYKALESLPIDGMDDMYVLLYEATAA